MGRKGFDPDIPVFERQPGESDPAWHAWVLYRDMQGHRSTAKVAQLVGKNKKLIHRWSSPLMWGWVERARAWDNHVDQQARQKQIRDVIAFRERAASQSRGKAQTMMLPDMAISQRLAKMQQEGKTIEEMFSGVSMEDLVFLALKSGSVLPHLLRSEALALGEATERAEVREGDTDALTKRIQDSDELRRLAATLIERAGTGDLGS
jgi:hypothetical protein